MSQAHNEQRYRVEDHGNERRYLTALSNAWTVYLGSRIAAPKDEHRSRDGLYALHILHGEEATWVVAGLVRLY
jgi:hypothetical protein